MSNIDYITIKGNDSAKLKQILSTLETAGQILESSTGADFVIRVNSRLLTDQMRQIEAITADNPEMVITAGLTHEYDWYTEAFIFTIANGVSALVRLEPNHQFISRGSAVPDTDPRLEKLNEKVLEICRRLDIQRTGADGKLHIDWADCETEISVECEGVRAKYGKRREELELISVMIAKEVRSTIWVDATWNDAGLLVEEEKHFMAEGDETPF